MELLSTDTPLVVQQWADFSLTLPAIGSSLTGFTWLAQVRSSRGDLSASPLGTFTVTVVDNTNGIVAVGLTNAQVATLFTNALAAKQPLVSGGAQLVCFWDIVGTSGSGVKTRFFQGPALLSLGVSH